MPSVSIIGFYVAAEPGNCSQDQSRAVPGDSETPGWKQPLPLPWRPAARVPRAGRGGWSRSAAGKGCPELSEPVAFSGDGEPGAFPTATRFAVEGKTQPLGEPGE